MGIEEAGHATPSQKFTAAPHRLGGLDFDGFLRETETGGGFAAGVTLDFVEDKHVTASSGQIGDGIGEDFDSFATGDFGGDIDLIIYDAQRTEIPYVNDG